MERGNGGGIEPVNADSNNRDDIPLFFGACKGEVAQENIQRHRGAP